MKRTKTFWLCYYGLILIISASLILIIVTDNYYVDWSIEERTDSQEIVYDGYVLKFFNASIDLDGNSGGSGTLIVNESSWIWLNESVIKVILVFDCEIIDYSINLMLITPKGEFIGTIFYEYNEFNWIELHLQFEELVQANI